MQVSALDNRSAVLDMALNFGRIGRFAARSPEAAAPFFAENRAYFAELDRRDLPRGFLPTYRAAKKAFSSLQALPSDQAADDAFTWASLLERRARFSVGEGDEH